MDQRLAECLTAEAVPFDEKVVLPPLCSDVEAFAARRAAERGQWLERLPITTVKALLWQDWRHLARRTQQPPDGDWRTWLILAGRGFGKTRAGAEWVLEQVRRQVPIRIALVAATLHEGRAVMIEGESGLLSIASGKWRPEWESSNRRLFWKETGAQAFLYSAGEPEMLRGPQHHHAWCDEIGKWARGEEAWRNLAMGLRLGSDPRTVATTTPRPVPLVRRLAGEADVAVTRGRTVVVGWIVRICLALLLMGLAVKLGFVAMIKGAAA